MRTFLLSRTQIPTYKKELVMNYTTMYKNKIEV